MKLRSQAIFISVVTALTVLAFQNCTQARFHDLQSQESSSEGIDNGQPFDVKPTVVSLQAYAEMAGQSVSVDVTFSRTVVVSGTPRLQLNSGSNQFADYVSGSGSSILKFSHSLSSGESVHALDYVSSDSLELNAGSIRDPSGADAILTLAPPSSPGSLSASSPLVIAGGQAVVPKIVQVGTDLGVYSGTSWSVTFSQPNAAGNLVLVICESNDLTSNLSVTDTLGNIYQTAFTTSGAVGGKWEEVAMFFSPNIAAGANTVTCHSDKTASLATQLAEYSGVAKTNSLISAKMTSGTNTALSSVTLTAPGANDLLIHYFSHVSNVPVSSDPNSVLEYNQWNIYNYYSNLQDRVVGLSGDYTLSTALSPIQTWLGIGAVFRRDDGLP